MMQEFMEEDLQGRGVLGLNVFSPDEISELAKCEDIIIIITTEKYTDEIVAVLDEKNIYNKKMICHIDYIGAKNANGALWGWYEEELKNNLGINLLSNEFDVEKGYSITNYRNIELLTMQLEKLNQLESVLADFVGIDSLELVNENIGDKKAYRYAYKQFQQDVKLPKEYVDFCYKNPYMEYFYSEADRKKYIKNGRSIYIKANLVLKYCVNIL